ncbi:MAG: hypothetical protein SVR94_00735 [Pseudomonadota bacterium]|nr:hypothetical protein [Pseudomonadota bacterium]
MRVLSLIILNSMLWSSAWAQTDTREILALTASHRTIILNEMHQFLTGVHAITKALAENDMETIQQRAKPLGMAMAENIPPELMKTLPDEFKKLGFAVHNQFDRIALDAQALENKAHTLTQMASLLNKCVACHDVYQIKIQE